MSDWTSTASVLIAAGGLAYTGSQFQLLTRDRKKERKLGIEGVCVSWFPEHNPRRDEVLSDGTAVWKYVFSVYNPGQFPISQVEVDIHFAMDVRRVRGQHLDDASHTLRLRQPVIAGGATRPWNRYLRIDYAAASRLRETIAAVTFIDSEGKHHENTWPKQLAGRD
ncbi:MULTISPECIES: hypothetical protein [unclassified Nocardioides]|uniref:hypothetical protein n=1 Tax=unclassified Nocardioides TaxID=2615069 RepID=UPI0030141E0E